VLELESRFSNSSLADFKHNLLSVQYAYLASLADSSGGKSVSELVAGSNPELDQKFKTQLAEAIAAIEAVPDPIEQNISDQEALAKLETAHTAVLEAFQPLKRKYCHWCRIRRSGVTINQGYSYPLSPDLVKV
jgi:putative iron-regulated protein